MGTMSEWSLRVRMNHLREDPKRTKRILDQARTETWTWKVKVVVKARTLKLTVIKT